MRAVIVTALLLMLAPGVLFAQAQAQDETAQRLKALEERIRLLEDEIRTLKEAQALPSAPPPATATLSSSLAEAAPTPVPAQTQAGGVIGGAPANAKLLNPDISMIGDFIATAGGNPFNPGPALEFHEAELGVQAVIDPYAKGDFFLSFGEEGVELEEGYITFTGLPKGFVARVGKMRSAFGVVNTLHNHTLPWIDRPLVTENLVGGEDGINDAGFSINRILPAPKGIFLEATGQVFRGDSADVFQSHQRSDLSYVGRLRGYKDLTEATNLDIGLSYARGHNDVGTNFLTQLFGTDVTLRWKPLRRAVYHSFLWRSEFVWSERQQLPTTQRAFGFYSAADYRLNRRWTVGGRFDRSDRARKENLTDNGFSAVLTYWPSEFSQIRTQYRFTRFGEGKDANELKVQLLFSLGAHGAHPF
ncbi:MAG: hypothetical protein ACRD3A_01610 [Terriglobales bacterium]